MVLTTDIALRQNAGKASVWQHTFRGKHPGTGRVGSCINYGSKKKVPSQLPEEACNTVGDEVIGHGSATTAAVRLGKQPCPSTDEADGSQHGSETWTRGSSTLSHEPHLDDFVIRTAVLL